MPIGFFTRTSSGFFAAAIMLLLGCGGPSQTKDGASRSDSEITDDSDSSQGKQPMADGQPAQKRAQGDGKPPAKATDSAPHLASLKVSALKKYYDARMSDSCAGYVDVSDGDKWIAEQFASSVAGCSGGNSASCMRLFNRYGQRIYQDEVARYNAAFQAACKKNVPIGCAMEGKALHNQGDARGMKLLKKACADGDRFACAEVTGDTLQAAWNSPDEVNRILEDTQQRCKRDGGWFCTFLVPKESRNNNIGAVQELFERACDTGYIGACLQGGLWMNSRVATPSDAAYVTRMFDKGCRNGDMSACRQLADRYLTGNGATKNLKLAQKMFEKACALGHADTCDYLASKARKTDALAYHKYCDRMGVHACLLAARELHDAMPQDARLARDMFHVYLRLMRRTGFPPQEFTSIFEDNRKACEAGRDVAQTCLLAGYVLAEGAFIPKSRSHPATTVVEKDPANAQRFFNKSCRAGNALACAELKCTSGR